LTPKRAEIVKVERAVKNVKLVKMAPYILPKKLSLAPILIADDCSIWIIIAVVGSKIAALNASRATGYILLVRKLS